MRDVMYVSLIQFFRFYRMIYLIAFKQMVKEWGENMHLPYNYVASKHAFMVLAVKTKSDKKHPFWIFVMKWTIITCTRPLNTIIYQGRLWILRTKLHLSALFIKPKTSLHNVSAYYKTMIIGIVTNNSPDGHQK